MTYLRQLNQTNARGRVCGTPKVGVLGSTVPRTGTNGAAPLVTAFGLTSADDAVEVLAVIETVSYTGLLRMDEDSSFVYTGANGSVTLRGYRGITDLGTAVVTLNADGSAATLVYADLVATYTISALVHADLVADYSIGSVTLVSADLAATYAIAGLVHADLVATYSVAQLVHADLVGTYYIGDADPSRPSPPLATVVFAGTPNLVVFGGTANTIIFTTRSNMSPDTMEILYKDPDDQRFYYADVTEDLDIMGTTAATVTPIVAGVTVLTAPAINGNVIKTKLGSLDVSTSPVNYCTLRITTADGQVFDRTTWFMRRDG